VELVATDGSGNRVVTQTGYGADGGVAFRIVTTTSPSGNAVLRRYDDNGDGVVDRVQRIDKVTNGDGSKTETVVNRVGADPNTAILVDRVVTGTSADGKVITINRDSTGGGWFDQREVWTTNADGSRMEVLSELAQDGTVIQSRSETVGISGLVRVEGTDLDGNGAAETVVSHTITVAGNNSRTEVVTVRNGDTTLRASETETVSADGKVRVVASDLDGDGDVDRTDAMAITGAAGSATTSVATVKNGDGSVRSVVTVVQSADALVKTTARDVDGDGDIDLTTVDATVIAGDGSRVRVVTATNTDGSVRQKLREVLGADKVTAETWVDQNQDGVFQTTDLVKSVVVDAGTQARTETVWARSADGSVRSQSVAVTSADGLSTTTTVDADGDGDTDTAMSDVTGIAAGVATRTVQVTNQNGSIRSREVTVTSADGLTVTRKVDIDGDGDFDSQTVEARVLGGDGSVTRTVSTYAGDGTTLTGRTRVVDSADRRTQTVTTDADGDGFTDGVVQSVEAVNGATTVTATAYHANGAVASQSISTISANDLVRNESTDVNGDGVFETVSSGTTVLNTDGSRVQTVDINNGDGSDRTLTVMEMSDDGLVVTTRTDSNGDGVFDRTTTATTVLAANGSTTRTDVVRDANSQMLSQSQMSVCDDGLVTVSRSDADGDGDFDLTTTQTTVLLSDGGTQVVAELRDLAGVLRSKITTISTDDARSITVAADVNGDGQTDRQTTRVVADTGTVTETVTEYSETGALLSREQTVVSDDGLTATRAWDRDGDGQFERRTEEVTVRNADGSVTRTSTGFGQNGSDYVRSTVIISDDGLTTIRSDDLDGDGTIDLTTLSVVSLATNGVRTETVEHRAEDTSLIDRRVVVTSADRRTITETADADGNGINDLVSVTTTAAKGQITTATDLLSTGGVLEARSVLTLSGDGLVRVETVDRNGDGRVDLRTTDTTELGSDGSVAQHITYHNGRNVLLARAERFVSDDGLERSTSLDANGDGVYELRGETVTTLHSDGSVETERRSFDGTSDLRATITTLQSGDGLTTTTVTEFTPYETATATTASNQSGTPTTTTTTGVSSDRVHSVTRAADGAVTEVTQTFGAGSDLQMELLQTVSADGRTRTMQADLDGDGTIDRDMVWVADLGRDQTTAYRDLKQNGALDSQVISTTSADGLTSVSSFDADGDGQADFLRSRSVTFAADGSEIVTNTEAFGGGTLGFQAVTTTAANGLLSVTQQDIDGDGSIDGTTTRETTLNTDGSRQITAITQYANGDVRSEFVTNISADGRATVERLDYDGNGIADKVVETTVLADGSRVEVETAYDKGGMRGGIFTTVTSADGLDVSIVRTGNQQTITRSALDNGSYAWNNGVTAAIGATNIVVAHEIDAFGIDTWTMTKAWQYTYTWSTSNGQQSATRNASSTATVRLDAEAKAQLFAEAARIYDAVLDRDLDFTEREQLVASIVDGQLDKSAVVASLLASGEFATRYGTLSNAEFVTQLYLNAVGRAPTLGELDQALKALTATAGTPTALTRAQVALEVAESIEHVVVGNGHLATNNFDVILNPAQFERSLDVAYTRSIVEKLVDTMYDRDATEQELDYLSKRLLSDVSNPDDLVALLRQQSGDLQGISSKTLTGLTGAALVEQAFINALGRQPTAGEQATWEQNLSSSYVTIDQFIASLAMSVEKAAAGNEHLMNAGPAINPVIGTNVANTLTGTAGQDSMTGLEGNDTLIAGEGSDRIIGGTGVDLLWGGAAGAAQATNGSDTYVWSKGDGNDEIRDWSQSQTEVDTLQLTNVTSTDVALTYSNTSGADLLITVLSTNEVIRIDERFQNVAYGYGLERIVFSDGVIWTLDDILARATMSVPTSTAATLTGTGYRDNLNGNAGNDTLYGGDGNDVLKGSGGADWLSGGNGSDTYRWSRENGGDTIDDTGLSTLDADRLILTDVASHEVEIINISPGSDVIVRIIGSGGADILIKNRHLTTGSVLQGNGVEVIEFSDGVVWELAEIFDRAVLTGTSGNDNKTGNNHDMAFKGLEGNDTLDGSGGHDTLDGGHGNDSLVGGNGADTYVWRKGDGNDTINDSDTTTFESDVLVFEDVTSDMVKLTRANGSLHLTITVEAVGAIPVEVITVLDKYNAGSNANSGIEEIRFADGVIWNLTDIRSHTEVNGTGAADALTGTAFIDNLYGFNGADTINAGANDDLLVGGQGADILDGAAGNDRFEWSFNDGDDILSDTSTVTTEVDTLALLNVASTGVVLTKVGADLELTIPVDFWTNEVITIKNRFNTAGDGRGIEIIEFSDGVTMDILAGPVANILTEGTDAAQTLTGWAFKDTQYGKAGNDILDAKAGDDVLYGGDGNDTLRGGTGSDSYFWSRGDDNDQIDDLGQSRTEIDTLILTDVLSPDDIGLHRAQGSVDMTLSINGSTEVLTIKNRFNTVAGAVAGYGIEQIVFADGTTWTLDDILAHVRLDGGTGNDALSGTVYADNIYGGIGNDTITAGNGNDLITGGTGADLLRGEGNSDTYVWSVGDGNDTVDDTSNSFTSVDKLSFGNVTPSQVVLTHASGSNNLVITVGTEVITVLNRFSNIANPYGIERIEFADGTLWTIEDILAQTKMNGTTGNDVLTSNGYADNMFGGGGNDTLNAGDGDDHLTGGTGTDSLAGGNGSDSYFWTKNDGSDTINDTGTSFADVDRLVLTNVASTDLDPKAALTRASGSSNVLLTITGTVTEVITLTNQMNSTTSAYGVDVIEFSDGVTWTLEDILDHVKVLGTATGTALVGTAFRDNIYGLGGNDTLTGSNGDDYLVGGTGADSLNGGSGVDTASYIDATQGVQVDLGLATAQIGTAGGEQIGDILVGIEALEGSTFADSLTGNADSNDLWGLGGNDSLSGKDGYDRLYGGDGNDTLNGGIGVDLLTGGTGADVFRFNEAAFGDDAIADFEDGFDQISFALTVADDFGDLTIAGNGTDHVMVSVGGQTIALHGAAPIQLAADDFAFS
jgi:Ca2+-binding RTX toxin-like protein